MEIHLYNVLDSKPFTYAVFLSEVDTTYMTDEMRKLEYYKFVKGKSKEMLRNLKTCAKLVGQCYSRSGKIGVERD